MILRKIVYRRESGDNKLLNLVLYGVFYLVMEESCQLEQNSFRPHSPMTCTLIGSAPHCTKKGPSPQPYFAKVGCHAVCAKTDTVFCRVYWSNKIRRGQVLNPTLQRLVVMQSVQRQTLFFAGSIGLTKSQPKANPSSLQKLFTFFDFLAKNAYNHLFVILQPSSLLNAIFLFPCSFSFILIPITHSFQI